MKKEKTALNWLIDFSNFKHDNPQIDATISVIWYAFWQLSNRYTKNIGDSFYNSLEDLSKEVPCSVNTLKGKNSPLKKMVRLGLIEYNPGKFNGKKSTFRLLELPPKGYIKNTLPKSKKGISDTPERVGEIDIKGMPNVPERVSEIHHNKDYIKQDYKKKRESKNKTSPTRLLYNCLEELKKDGTWNDAIRFVVQKTKLDIDLHSDFLKKIIDYCDTTYKTRIDNDGASEWEKGVTVDGFKGYLINKIKKEEYPKSNLWLECKRNELMQRKGFDSSNPNHLKLWKNLRVEKYPEIPSLDEPVYFRDYKVQIWIPKILGDSYGDDEKVNLTEKFLNHLIQSGLENGLYQSQIETIFKDWITKQPNTIDQDQIKTGIDRVENNKPPIIIPETMTEPNKGNILS